MIVVAGVQDMFIKLLVKHTQSRSRVISQNKFFSQCILKLLCRHIEVKRDGPLMTKLSLVIGIIFVGGNNLFRLVQ